MIIAIDGPAGSGKSSTARIVASRLGFLYLDTGAMYRAVALSFMRRQAPVTEAGAAEVLAALRLAVRTNGGEQRVLLDGEDVSEAIRDPDVSAVSSQVSALPSVRAFLVLEQRRLAGIETVAGRGVVMEGRDIGTVVFPTARLKVFLTADPAVRARRRAREYAARGVQVEEDTLLGDMAERDRHDSTRSVSPLRPSDDAVLVDTTLLSLEEQVGRIVEIARERGA